MIVTECIIYDGQSYTDTNKIAPVIPSNYASDFPNKTTVQNGFGVPPPPTPLPPSD
jgi:hypothetical protein